MCVRDATFCGSGSIRIKQNFRSQNFKFVCRIWQAMFGNTCSFTSPHHPPELLVQYHPRCVPAMTEQFQRVKNDVVPHQLARMARLRPTTPSLPALPNLDLDDTDVCSHGSARLVLLISPRALTLVPLRHLPKYIRPSQAQPTKSRLGKGG